MTGFQSKVTIPESLVEALIKKGATAVTMEATVLDVHASDAKPGNDNAANTPISYGPVTLYPSMSAVFLLPQYPITIGRWTASKAGTMNFTAGNAVLTLTAPKLTVDVKCKPQKPPVTIATTTVS